MEGFPLLLCACDRLLFYCVTPWALHIIIMLHFGKKIRIERTLIGYNFEK